MEALGTHGSTPGAEVHGVPDLCPQESSLHMSVSICKVLLKENTGYGCGHLCKRHTCWSSLSSQGSPAGLDSVPCSEK